MNDEKFHSRTPQKSAPKQTQVSSSGHFISTIKSDFCNKLIQGEYLNIYGSEFSQWVISDEILNKMGNGNKPLKCQKFRIQVKKRFFLQTCRN